MEICRKIETGQAEGKTGLIEVNWGCVRSTLGAHLTPRALEALCFSNTAAFKTSAQLTKTKKIRSESANCAFPPPSS